MMISMNIRISPVHMKRSLLFQPDYEAGNANPAAGDGANHTDGQTETTGMELLSHQLSGAAREEDYDEDEEDEDLLDLDL